MKLLYTFEIENGVYSPYKFYVDGVRVTYDFFHKVRKTAKSESGFLTKRKALKGKPVVRVYQHSLASF